MWLGSGGARTEHRFFWPQEQHSFHYASPLPSITGNCQGSLAQNATYQLCKTKTSFCLFSNGKVQRTQKRKKKLRNKPMHTRTWFMIKVASFLCQWRKDWLFNNAEKTGSLNESGRLDWCSHSRDSSGSDYWKKPSACKPYDPTNTCLGTELRETPAQVYKGISKGYLWLYCSWWWGIGSN